MFNDYKPKLTFSKNERNILMNQIRAEQYNYRYRQEPIFMTSSRLENTTGKKMFKEHLYRTTILNQDRSAVSPVRNQCMAFSPIHQRSSKRTGYDVGQGIEHVSPSRKSRHPLAEKYYNTSYGVFEWSNKQYTESSPQKYTRKRFDQSPNHQSRLSPGFNIFKKWE
jgi:hypothetical protein